ncbi:MAG: ABC transporter substrate-binding protein, partial [Sporichthyaceae bacterium]
MPVVVGLTLIVSACGSSSATQPVAAPAPAPAADTTPDSTAKLVEAVAAYLSAQSAPKKDPELDTAAAKALKKALSEADDRRAAAAKAIAVRPSPGVVAVRPNGEPTPEASPEAKVESQSAFERTGGATDTGVTRNSIKLGTISMHGMALSKFVVAPVVRGNIATITAINERGGVLGRRLSVVDCDDGPGEVSRAKSCLKKLVVQDKIFSLVSSIDWATASLHDDLKQHGLPYVGSWAYSQTEWQDPYMFPTHMSMIHEAMAGANWVRDVIKPKTYGLLCLT